MGMATVVSALVGRSWPFVSGGVTPRRGPYCLMAAGRIAGSAQSRAMA